MKIAYTAPAKGEGYLISKNDARRVARELFSELPLLAFQTMHGPNMSSEVPYLATFSSQYVRILSLRTEWVVPDLIVQFREVVLPHLCKRARQFHESSYSWPLVVVAVEGNLHEVTCSEGGLFPSLDEIVKKIRKHPASICGYVGAGATPA